MNNSKVVGLLFVWLSVSVLVETQTNRHLDLIEVVRKEMAETDSIETSSKSRRLCGTALIRALLLVCSPENNDKNLVNVKPSFTKWEAIYRQKRFKRGVVNACCQKTCDLSDLSKYCR